MSAPVGGSLRKAPTGIQGLDEVTGGGLPAGRPTLICGSAGCGKTLLAMEFLVRGATEFGEPGVFIAFEETEEELVQNVRSLGFDLAKLIARKKMAIDYIHIERSEIEETGEFDLGGLFIRLEHAVRTIGAKRVVLDTIEALFGGLPNEGILRAELRRLFRWLKDRKLTAVITGERGDGLLTRYGLEEYVADCVISLDHRVRDQVSTRRVRVVKYRGSIHGTNEYPFLISERGISVLPITSLALDHPAPQQRISTGVPPLDVMLGKKGVYRGSSILVSGNAGTGKSTLAAHFVNGACQRGERALYFAFEESQQQILRNMRSIGLRLNPWVDKGLLRFHASRPNLHGLEMHLLRAYELVEEFKPSVIVFDPITNLTATGDLGEVKAMLMRLLDFLKLKGVTTMFISLTEGGEALEQTEIGISSLMDVWLLLRDLEYNGERNRTLYVLKARGLAHSNQVREFVLTNKGIDLVEVYLGDGQTLTGSARVAQAAREDADALASQQEGDRKRRHIQRERQIVEARIAALKAELEAQEDELQRSTAQQSRREQTRSQNRDRLKQVRQVDLAHSSKSQSRRLGRNP
jgi:circadian clock protein KaiC